MAFVLKHDSSQPERDTVRGACASGLAGFNLNDFAAEGRQQLDACRAQIRELLSQAEQDAEQIRRDARAQGYQQGLEQAAADFETKLKAAAEVRAQEQLAVIRSAAEQMRQTYQLWMSAYRDSLTTVALSAAERIVGRQLEREPELVARWADEALQHARSATQLSLAVHPEILAELGQTLDELLASPDLPEQTSVEADEELGKSDVVVRQAGGEIQAGLTARLERLRELLG